MYELREEEESMTNYRKFKDEFLAQLDKNHERALHKTFWQQYKRIYIAIAVLVFLSLFFPLLMNKVIQMLLNVFKSFDTS
jgi:hypothetical protein